MGVWMWVENLFQEIIKKWRAFKFCKDTTFATSAAAAAAAAGAFLWCESNRNAGNLWFRFLLLLKCQEGKPF